MDEWGTIENGRIYSQEGFNNLLLSPVSFSFFK